MGSGNVKTPTEPKMPRTAFADAGASAVGPQYEKLPLHVKLMRWLGR